MDGRRFAGQGSARKALVASLHDSMTTIQFMLLDGSRSIQ
jgi:hypothetical protein